MTGVRDLGQLKSGHPSERTVRTASLEAAADRMPAPGGLELVRAFINSGDIEAGTDALATETSAAGWFREHGLPLADGGIGEGDRARLIAFREALRELLAGGDDGSDGTALVVLDRIARTSPLTVAFDGGRHVGLRATEAGASGLIGRVLGEIAVASATGTWSRLKVCRNDACRWAFYDGSRNRSGVWCAMAVCGNRSKGRSFRRRRRPAR